MLLLTYLLILQYVYAYVSLSNPALLLQDPKKRLLLWILNQINTWNGT